MTHEYFQQDNANDHKVWESINYVAKFFGEKFLSKGLWASKSPDLTSGNVCCVIIWKMLHTQITKEPLSS
jgi:hypothetical protein